MVMSLPIDVQEAEKKADEMIKGNTTQAPKDPQPQTPPNQVETPPKATSNNVDWKAKYDVLQGKYNNEVPTLIDKVKSLESSALAPNESDQDLRNENLRLKQELDQAQQRNVAEPNLALDKHLVAEYGEEFAKAVANTAKAQVDAVKSEFDHKINQQEQHISSWTNESKMTAIQQSLSGLNIDFNQVDKDPLFHDWLNKKDDYSGSTRQQMMVDAFNQGDLNRVIRFYTAFMDSQKQRSENHPFNQHIEAPPSDVTHQGTQQKVFDSDAFQDLHKRYQRGHISDDEFVKAEREMYAALSR